QKQYKDLLFLLVAKEAMNGIEKILTKYEALKNRKIYQEYKKIVISK
ncbi:15649_t:CDS:1, partial [Gigaspora margarita]